MNEHLCLLVGVHFPIGSQHYWLWSDKCRHYLCFTRNIKRSFVRILELVNDFRQIPTCFAGASFLMQDFQKTCNSDTREDARIHMTVFFLQNLNRHGISLVSRVFLFIARSLWGFLLLAVSQFCLRVGCGRRRSSFCLWLLPLFPGTLGSWLKVHKSPFEHCPCAFHWKHSRVCKCVFVCKCVCVCVCKCVCVCVCCVVCVYMWCCVVVCVLCGCVLCGWCAFLCFCVVLLFFCLSILFFLFLALSLSFSLLSLFSLLSSVFSSSSTSLFSLLFSSPNTVERPDQPTRRPTSRHLNVICRTAGAQQSVLSLLLSPPSSLLSLSSSKKKKRELFITGIFPARNLFFITVLNKFQKLAAGENYCHYSFYINSKTLGL